MSMVEGGEYLKHELTFVANFKLVNVSFKCA